MIRLVTTFDIPRLPMLEQFLSHYRQAGVESLHISLHLPADAQLDHSRREQKECRSLVWAWGGVFEGVVRFPYDSRILRAYHDRLQQRFSSADWIMWADSDEFHDFHPDLATALNVCEEAGSRVVLGEFIDRIAEDGRLIGFRPGQSIWEQFPLGCHFSRDVMKADTQKVVCARADVGVMPGNHRPWPGQCVGVHRVMMSIHHFKWSDEVVERLKHRISPEWQRTHPWWRESERALDHIAAYGRIDLSSLEVTRYFRTQASEERREVE